MASTLAAKRVLHAVDNNRAAQNQLIVVRVILRWHARRIGRSHGGMVVMVGALTPQRSKKAEKIQRRRFISVSRDR